MQRKKIRIWQNNRACRKMCPITFATLTINELSTLHGWFLQPHVAYWWPEPSPYELFQAKWSTRIETKLSAYNTPWFGHVVKIDNIPIGYIQHFFLTAQQCHGYPLSLENSAGLDFLIGEPAYVGKKLSTPIIERYLQLIKLNHIQITTVLIEPTYANRRAIHVYHKAGFSRLGCWQDHTEQKLLMFRSLSAT